MAEDIINNPSHYHCEAVTITFEPIDLCEQCGFLFGNGLKYLFRYQHKGKPVEDLKKARYYFERYAKSFEDSELNVCVAHVDPLSIQYKVFKDKPFFQNLGGNFLSFDALKMVEWINEEIKKEEDKANG